MLFQAFLSGFPIPSAAVLFEPEQGSLEPDDVECGQVRAVEEKRWRPDDFAPRVRSSMVNIPFSTNRRERLRATRGRRPWAVAAHRVVA